jgi:hypothetical protein
MRICVGSLLVPSVASAVFAQANSSSDKSVKRPFMLHAAMQNNVPHADVIIGEDGAKITRRAKIHPAVAEQINQARAQTGGNLAVHYIVPGHMTTGL